MYSKSFFPLAALAWASLCGMAAPKVEPGDMVAPTRKLQPAYARPSRGKGPQAKPAKRSNRLHISRRTRRKHRRAA